MILTRRALLRTSLLALGATALRAAEPPVSSAPEIKVEPMGGPLHLITGAGGNILSLTGGDGTLLIDTGLADVSAGTAAKVAEIAPGPVGLVINTHWHFDHAGGNERFAKAGARIVATSQCRARLSSEQHNDFFDKTWPASPLAALPILTFAADTTMYVNGETLHLYPVEPAHTDGDVFIHLEKANVIHCGDLFFHGIYPFIDSSSGGWIGGMVAAAKRILALCQPDTRVIPGHGPLTSTVHLERYVRYMEIVHERLEKLKTEGKSVDEAVAAEPTKEFDEKLGQGFFKPEQFVRFAYAGLLKHG